MSLPGYKTSEKISVRSAPVSRKTPRRHTWAHRAAPRAKLAGPLPAWTGVGELTLAALATVTVIKPPKCVYAQQGFTPLFHLVYFIFKIQVYAGLQL